MSDVETKTDGEEEEAEQPEAEQSPLEQLEAERDKLKDQLLRMAADFDNYRKRTRKDAEQAEKKGKEDILKELLPVFDNLERAMKASEETQEIDGILEGIEMVLKLFEDTAQRIGLTRVESVGQRFDPSIHDAFQQLETDEKPPGTILAEYQPGYRLGDKLIRPSMVVVARKRSDSGGDAG